ncbi:hypothetical protein Bca4012_095449 [Brassica carinata]
MISLEQITAYNQSITSDFHAAIEEGDTRGATTPREHKPTTAVLTEPLPPGSKNRRGRTVEASTSRLQSRRWRSCQSLHLPEPENHN